MPSGDDLPQWFWYKMTILLSICTGILEIFDILQFEISSLDFQSEFSMSKIIRIFLIFFSLRNKILGAHFLLELFFGNFNFKTTSNWVAEGVASDVN